MHKTPLKFQCTDVVVTAGSSVNAIRGLEVDTFSYEEVTAAFDDQLRKRDVEAEVQLCALRRTSAALQRHRRHRRRDTITESRKPGLSAPPPSAKGGVVVGPCISIEPGTFHRPKNVGWKDGGTFKPKRLRHASQGFGHGLEASENTDYSTDDAPLSEEVNYADNEAATKMPSSTVFITSNFAKLQELLINTKVLTFAYDPTISEPKVQLKSRPPTSKKKAPSLHYQQNIKSPVRQRRHSRGRRLGKIWTMRGTIGQQSRNEFSRKGQGSNAEGVEKALRPKGVG